MGIYDRDYYRRDGPSYLGSFLERGLICKWLIGINIVVFVLQMLTRGQDQNGAHNSLTSYLSLNIDAVLHGQVWRLLTYAFLHDPGYIWHIVFNMLFLWWFGTDVEDLYGPWEFLAFYLAAAIAGGLAFTVTGLATGGNAVGASGAITAVLVLCAIHYPKRIVYIMFVLPVPIWIFVIVSIAMDAYHWLGSVNNGVAVTCHLGGAAFAFGYYKFGVRLTRLLPDLRKWNQHRSTPRLRVYREDEENAVQKPQPVSVATAPGGPASTSLDDEQLEAKMDAVLEKISRVGKDKLTESEKEVLLRASERIKKRRS
jgi:membrane associated rhomboid family serine protease